VLLTGGGTGGHVNPALAIAEGIKKRQPNTRFLYVGVRGKAEAIIVERAGYPLHFVPAVGYPGLRPSWRLLRFVFCLLMGTAKSLGILFQFTPSLIVATGGYVSAPMVLAGLVLRSLRIAPIRIFVHEQNSIPGQMNAFIGRWADRVLLTFPQTLHVFSRNGVVVGYPVRHSIAFKPRMEALSSLSLDIPPERKIVFVFGGSQGSRTINRGIVDALRYMLPHRDHLFIIHGMGLAKSADYNCLADTEKRLQSSFTAEELELLQAFYFRQDYFHNIADVYSISDLIVCRSGAGSLNEISRLQKPALLIPKANLPGDHQVMNARALKHAGAAEILFEDTAIENGLVLEKVEGKALAERILRLLHDPDRLAEMGQRSGVFFRRHATQLILNELYGDGSYMDDVSFENAPLRPLLSNNRLLAVLDGAYRRHRQGFDPLQVIGDQDDLVYYQYRAAALLTHGPWQDRNVGVKLMGLTQCREKIPALLHMLADRTPASWSNRLFGGDFEQVGFIRRNIVRSLQVMNCFNADIEKHLLAALEDPYFEVRAEVCRALAHFGWHLAGKKGPFQNLLQHLNDDSFEVVVEAAKAIGELGVDGGALSALLGLQDRFHWQVRDAALQGIKRLLERRVISPSAQLFSQISHFVLTSTDFRPHFSIKETYKGIEEYCRQKAEEQDHSGNPPAGCSVLTGQR
jgi:UDP-N-acetylglucosamine--N-acetylmuramyl-(pentapeptide) pyrophosphoryl-undecaprenol N-acetylglucosamine transferase